MKILGILNTEKFDLKIIKITNVYKKIEKINTKTNGSLTFPIAVFKNHVDDIRFNGRRESFNHVLYHLFPHLGLWQ